MKVPTSILADAERLASGAVRDTQRRGALLERLLGRPNKLWSSERLAASVGASVDESDAELAAVLVDRAAGTLGPLADRLGRHVLRRHVQGWSCGPVGVFEHLKVPSAYEVERWVHAEDHAVLDAALAATKTTPPRAAFDAPPLRWRSGPRLSAGAHAWYVSQLLAGTFVLQTSERDASRPVRGAAGLVEPALDEQDTVAMARWVLRARLPASSRARVPRTVAAIDWLGQQVETGELPRSRALQLMGTDRIQSRRWAFRWGELRSPRYPDAISDERIEGLWPTDDDPTGTRRQWATWVGEVLQRAMTEQRGWRFEDFEEAYLRHPLASPIAEGLVYVMGGLPLVFIDGQAHGIDGKLTLMLGGELRVAHPAEGVEDWPMPVASPPFAQREHRVLSVAELPSPPAEPVPHGAWKRRVRALRLLSDVQTNGSTTAELWLLGHHRVHIDHAGYGSGLGGARPISKIQVSVRAGSQPPLATLDAQERHGWDSLPPWLVSEVARMLRVLFGLSPLPRSSRPG
ncbi:MAG: DUF4132 domain-containing protein [Myxococcales bacterium]|nr:DUF4132 domain-containing protein [Myxococcales bacterium]